MMKISRCLPCLVLSLLLLTTGCGIKNSIVTKPMDKPEILVSELNPKISMKQLKDIIIGACTKQGWAITGSTASSVEATLNHMGKETVTIDIPFSPQKVSFVYKSSQNMRYDGTKIHRSYNRWLKSLEVNIRNGIVAVR